MSTCIYVGGGDLAHFGHAHHWHVSSRGWDFSPLAEKGSPHYLPLSVFFKEIAVTLPSWNKFEKNFLYFSIFKYMFLNHIFHLKALCREVRYKCNSCFALNEIDKKEYQYCKFIYNLPQTFAINQYHTITEELLFRVPASQPCISCKIL